MNLKSKKSQFSLNIFDYQARLTFAQVAVVPCFADAFALWIDSLMAFHLDRLVCLHRAAGLWVEWYRKVPWTEQSPHILKRSTRKRVFHESCRLKCAYSHVDRKICTLNDQAELELCSNSMARLNDFHRFWNNPKARRRRNTATHIAIYARREYDRWFDPWNQRMRCPLDIWQHREVFRAVPATTQRVQIEYKLISPTAKWTKRKCDYDIDFWWWKKLSIFLQFSNNFDFVCWLHSIPANTADKSLVLSIVKLLMESKSCFQERVSSSGDSTQTSRRRKFVSHQITVKKKKKCLWQIVIR